MRITLRARLASLLMSCMLALAPLPLMAEVYKCKRDGKYTYSTTPCGAKQLQVATELSVTPGYQRTGSASSGGMHLTMGLSAQAMIPLVLLLMVPLAFAVGLFLWRRSSKKQKEQRLLPPYLP